MVFLFEGTKSILGIPPATSSPNWDPENAIPLLPRGDELPPQAGKRRGGSMRKDLAPHPNPLRAWAERGRPAAAGASWSASGARSSRGGASAVPAGASTVLAGASGRPAGASTVPTGARPLPARARWPPAGASAIPEGARPETGGASGVRMGRDRIWTGRDAFQRGRDRFRWGDFRPGRGERRFPRGETAYFGGFMGKTGNHPAFQLRPTAPAPWLTPNRGKSFSPELVVRDVHAELSRRD